MQIKHENAALALEIASCVAVDVLHCLKRDAGMLMADAWRRSTGWLDSELPFCLKRERDVLAADLAQMIRSRDLVRNELMGAVETIGQLRTREAVLIEQAAQLTATVEASRSSALNLAGERDLWKAKAEEMAARLEGPSASAAEAGEPATKAKPAVEPGKPARTKRKAPKNRKKVGRTAGAA